MRSTFSRWIGRFWSAGTRGDLHRQTGGSRGKSSLPSISLRQDRASRRFVTPFCLLLLLTVAPASGSIDDVIASALRALDAYAKQGYTVHEEDEWGGDLGVNESKVISHPLVHGNDYWFCLGTDVSDARVSIHVYNEQGKLVETKAWQDGSHAAAEAVNPRTANYYIVVEVTASSAERTHWAMVYGSRAVGEWDKHSDETG
jgi:hypothetical protein